MKHNLTIKSVTILFILIIISPALLAANISSDFPYKKKSIKVLNSHISYIDEGAGQTVLMLHGNPTSSYIWRNIIPYITPHSRAVAIDLIGMGDSGKPNIDYRFNDHALYLKGFIEALDLKDVIIVAQDWGSALGLNYAMQHQDNIKGIVLLEAMLKPFELEDFRPKFRALLGDFRHPVKGKQLLIEDNQFITKVLPGQTQRILSAVEHNTYAKHYVKKESRIPIWRWPVELPIAGYPQDNHLMMETYSDKLIASKHPKLLFYASPGALMPADKVSWAKAKLSNVTYVDLGKGIHHLQEENPHAIGGGLSTWLQMINMH